MSRIEETLNYYQELFSTHGVSPKALGWPKGRQMTRFAALFSRFKTLDSPTVLDIGCGFGDLNRFLEKQFCNYTYTGIDLVPEFLDAARDKYAGRKNVHFLEGDFLGLDIEQKFDLVVASGVFNSRLSNAQNYVIFEKSLGKAFGLCKVGVAFDFLSDKVDFELENAFHWNPGKVLESGYALSRNLVLLNDYIPFEFCLCLRKDTGFSVKKPLFKSAEIYMA